MRLKEEDVMRKNDWRNDLFGVLIVLIVFVTLGVALEFLQVQKLYLKAASISNETTRRQTDDAPPPLMMIAEQRTTTRNPRWSEYAAAATANTTTREAAAGLDELSSLPLSLDSVEKSIQTGIERFLSVNGGKQEFTVQDCIQTSLTCGTACGNNREHQSTACWCVRLYGNQVTYLHKRDEFVVHRPHFQKTANEWYSDTYRNFQVELNTLQLAIVQANMTFDTPVYLVLNTFDYPRLFTTDKPEYPRITKSHPGETIHDLEFFKYQSIQGGFPHQPMLRPRFRCGSPLHHFPILSWSVSPLYNFDILAPHAHPGDCYDHVLEPSISHTPWHSKSNSVVFHGSFGACNIDERFDHRSRFCGMIQQHGDAHARALNVTWDVTKDSVPPSEQARSKFLVLLDGAVAAFRSSWYLATGSVILAAGHQVDIRTALLIPYVHYIPFAPDYSDFFEKLALVARDDEYAAWIGENARRVGKRTSMDHEGVVDGGFTFDKEYWRILLQKYNETFRFQNHAEDVLQNFTNDRNCEGFVADGNHCMRNASYACQGLLQDGMPTYAGLSYINVTKR